VEIDADFRTDLIEHCKAELIRRGYTLRHIKRHKDKTKPDPKTPVEPFDYVNQYFNVAYRLVPAKPRNVVVHPALSCPPARQKGLGLLLQRVEAGGDLTPYLSRQLYKAGFADMLLNDWGIQHFHLGERLDAKGQIEGHDEVLFAIVTETAFYCLSVLRHGAWADQRNLIDVVEGNWPELIKHGHSPGVLPAKPGPTDQEILELRNAGVQTYWASRSGMVYVLVGGGYATSGDSLIAVDAARDHLRVVTEWEEALREEVRAMAAEAVREGKTVTVKRRRFRLEFTDPDFFVAVEDSLGLRKNIAKRPVWALI
jgi:hypothetical protein